jgi:hypothetical protein
VRLRRPERKAAAAVARVAVAQPQVVVEAVDEAALERPVAPQEQEAEQLEPQAATPMHHRTTQPQAVADSAAVAAVAAAH